MDSRHEARPLLGILCRVISAFCFTFMSLAVQLLAERIPIGEMLFFRNALAMVPMLIWAAWLGELGSVFPTERLSRHFMRALVGITAMSCFFAALERLPLTDVTAINFASPLIIVVLAALVLGERVRLVRGSAVVIGFVGILIILSDYTGGQQVAGDERSVTGALIAVAATCLSAIVAIIVRQLTRTEAVHTIVFYFSVFSSAIALLSLPFGWVVPSWSDLGLLLTLGLVGGVGQLFITASYAYADASVVAPFEYTAMIWAVILGYLAFGHLPTVAVVVGAVVVIFAGLIIIFRERQLARERARAPAVPVAESEISGGPR